MDILILGGTGAMGVPLVRRLAKVATVYVTTRKNSSPKNVDTNGVRFILGNAKDVKFLKSILAQRHWDAIIDFMIWSKEFKEIVKLMLNATDQYVFISSARVYAQSNGLITENTPRLLDIIEDSDYLKTNEYALAKAREENILFKSGKKNFTIIRPTVTYNDYRLQLGVLEKENWLYRALHGRSIVFSDDIADKLTTMTFGDDVSEGIASVVGKKEAYGEAYHITYNNSLPWSDVFDIYLSELESHLGYRPHVIMTKKSTNLLFPNKKYQVIYCRYFNRTFDNSKIAQFCDPTLFKRPEEGLRLCLQHFLSRPNFSNIDWTLEAVNDRVARERTPLSEIQSMKSKLSYLAYRYNVKILLLPLKMASRVRNIFLYKKFFNS